METKRGSSSEGIGAIVETLVAEFATVFGTVDVERMVVESMDLLEGIRSGPLKKNEVESFTRIRLQAQGRNEGSLLAGVP